MMTYCYTLHDEKVLKMEVLMRMTRLRWSPGLREYGVLMKQSEQDQTTAVVLDGKILMHSK